MVVTESEPSGSPLISPESISGDSVSVSWLINAYFLCFHPFYPLLHEKAFREKATNWKASSPNSKPSWIIVYYMVLAIGQWTSTFDKGGQSPYYSAARSQLTIQMLESGTVETVQAFMLMASSLSPIFRKTAPQTRNIVADSQQGYYLQRKDRPNTSYNFIGIAYRMALGLGLHREISQGEDVIVYERRRRIFWTLYCWDNGFSITTGRPPMASDTSIDARLPRNVDDQV
jgi:transcriptional regulatory protein GAL4